MVRLLLLTAHLSENRAHSLETSSEDLAFSPTVAFIEGSRRPLVIVPELRDIA